MRKLTGWFCAVLLAHSVFADNAARQAIVELSASVQADPLRIQLVWSPREDAAVYRIFRKSYASPAWGEPIALLPAAASGYLDEDVQLGLRYEYQVELVTRSPPWPGGNSNDWQRVHGYLAAGIEASALDAPGKLILAVESSIRAPLRDRIERLRSDLRGDGWTVLELEASRGDSPASLRARIKELHALDPANTRALFLLGRLPVPYSGNINPDGHSNHAGAWPADGFYGELDAAWDDSVVSNSTAEDPRNHNQPGDGKFDPSLFPDPVDLEVGRVDLSDLPAFLPLTETELLARYLDKNHAYRHKQFSAADRALVRDNFGEVQGDTPASSAWRNFVAFFGVTNVLEAAAGEFLSTLEQEDYLWAFGAGGGSYRHIDGLGQTADFARQNPKAVFLMLDGSYFGDWDNYDNLLRAPLATDRFTLAVFWSGLPHHFLHRVALGGSLGESLRLIQNNNGLYRAPSELGLGQVHIALMGDPTLRMQVVAPPRQPQGAATNGGVFLTWQASTDPVAGYHLYHATNGLFHRVTSAPVSATSFFHSAPMAGTNEYMIRAVQLKQSASGSFYHLSQGAFAAVFVEAGNPLPNQSPVFSGLTNLLVDEDALIELHFELTDDRTPTPAIQLSVLPRDVHLLPTNQISISASNGWRVVRIRPAAKQSGSASLDFIANDGELFSTNTIQVSVQAVNDPPVAHAQSISLREDESADIQLEGTDVETNQLTFLIVDQPAHGELTGQPPVLRYLPSTNYFGTDQFSFKVSDGGGESAAVQVLLQVTPVNDPPVAHAQSIMLREDETAVIQLEATDAETNELTFLIVGQPAHGELSGQPPALRYLPSTNYFGPDQFWFKVSDGSAESAVVQVLLQATPVNDPPLAHAQSIILREDEAAPIQLEGSDAETNELAFLIVDQPAHGELTGQPPALRYLPSTHYFGSDQFSFKVSDGSGESAVVQVLLQATPVNDPPVAHAQNITLREDEAVAIQLEGSDAETNVLTFLIVDQPAHGELTGQPPALRYLPSTNYFGPDQFSFKVSDGSAESAAVQVQFQISPVNDPPWARSYTVAMPMNSRLRLARTNLLANVDDPDSPILVLTNFPSQSNARGTVALEPEWLIYEPRAGFTGLDEIQYFVIDQLGAAAQASLLIKVSPPAHLEIVPGSPECRIHFSGIPGELYRIESSADLVEWRELETLTADSSGLVEVIVSTDSAARFFRVIQL